MFKICLNHILTSDIKYLPKDDKTWLFYASDYSEGELANEQFCLRFKTAEIAQEFMKAVNDALSGEISDTGKILNDGNTLLVIFVVCISLMAYFLYRQRKS